MDAWKPEKAKEPMKQQIRRVQSGASQILALEKKEYTESEKAGDDTS